MENFRRERQVQVSNKSRIKVAKYSPDGGHLALLAEDNLISVMDNASNRMYRIDCTTYGEVRDIEFSKSSKIIGVAANDVMALFGNPVGKPYKRPIKPDQLEPHDYFTRIFFGHENVLIGVSRAFRHIYVYYDYTDITPKYFKFMPHTSIITSLSFISISSIITSYSDGMCIKWNGTYEDDSREQEVFPNYKRDFPIPVIKITHTDLSPDNNFLLLTHACSKISSYQIQERMNFGTITFLRIYQGHKGNEIGLHEMKGKFMFHDKRKFVISGSETFSIYIWDFETAEVVRTLNCGEELPVSIIFNPLENSERFAVLQGNGQLFIWKKERRGG